MTRSSFIRNQSLILLVLLAGCSSGCSDESGPSRQLPSLDSLRVYDNPVLPGDHPDMNIYIEGDSYYLTGSSFNMSPNVEILHSYDLIHWERVSRVVDAAWSGLQSSIAGGGTWGGFIVKTSDGYRVYFSVNFGQYFASATSLEGPWSEPVQVNSFPYTVPSGEATFNRGNGYDDSVFVDDDGKTYMVIKAGQCKWNGKTGGEENNFGVNTLTEIDPASGMLKEDSTIDLSFMNWNVENGGCGDPENDAEHAKSVNWAEGPTLMKRNGFYYYFVSTHTACGGTEYVWRSATLSSNPDDWTPLGTFLVGDAPFTGAQHSTAPFQVPNGTWWAFSHSYECMGGWRGLGRQGLLTQVTWENDVPISTPAPVAASGPNLEERGTPLLLPVNDDFQQPALDRAWSFYGYAPETRYSLSERPGWLRIKPEAGQTQHVVQKDALHANAMVSLLNFVPTIEGDAAGIRLGNAIGDEQQLLKMPTWNKVASIELSLARVWDGGDKIRFSFRTVVPVLNEAGDAYESLKPTVNSESVAAPSSDALWLKIVRDNHSATGWYSLDRLAWTQVGKAIDTSSLDDYDAVSNGWVGNQAGVFASNTSADFDQFSYRDGFSEIPAALADLQSGTSVVNSTDLNREVLASIEAGDIAVFGSVDLGGGTVTAHSLELQVASAQSGSSVEVWLGPLPNAERIATCAIASTGGWDEWKTVTCPLRTAGSGSHDVYLKAEGGSGELLRLASLRFRP